MSPAEATGAPARPRSGVLALFFAAYLGGAGFAQWLAFIPGTGISIWPPAGLYIATLVLAPRAQWPWWIAAALAAELLANAIWFGNPFAVALAIHVGNALTALAGAWLTTRVASSRPFVLETLGDVLALAAFGALAAPLASAVVGGTTLALAEGLAWSRGATLLWIGDATGVLIVAPLVLVAAAAWRERGRLPALRILEAVAVGAALVGSAAVSLGGTLPFAYIVTLPLLWAAVRFEFRGAVLALVLLALMAAAYARLGSSTLVAPELSAQQRHVMMQLFLAVSALWALVVAAIARQQRRALEDQRAVNDALERRVAERTAALSSSEQRFRILTDTVPMAIWVHDAAGRLEFVNREYERFFGVTEAQVRDQGWQPLLHPQDKDAYVQAFMDAMARHHDFEATARVRRADGAWRSVAARGVVRWSDEGEFLGIVGCSPDVTDRQRYEQSLAEDSRRKDDFLAMLGHELRNPLAPMRSAVELMRVTAVDETPALRRAREVLERQLGHLVRLVDDLLDVSRVSRGKITLRRATVDLGAAVQQAVETHRRLIDERGQSLRLVLPAQPVAVEGDATRLVQAIGNLVHNAAKYTHPGGHIEVVLEADGAQHQARVRVRDDGRGIEPRLLDATFDLFYQVESSLDRSEGGLGIGLALARRLAQLHGGDIVASSDGPGHGSEFVLWLPSLRGAAAAASPATEWSKEQPLAGPARRVLVVDDNRDAADTIAELLRCEGHQVAIAYDGRAAVECALRERPEVVLLDLGLPHLDGYQACRGMRDAGLGGALIIALTGYGQPQDRALSADAGFDGHEVKPIDPARLRTLLTQVPSRP